MDGSRRLNELADRVLGGSVVPEGPVTIALSGGADSAICGWLLARRGGDVTAVHVDHRLPDSPSMVSAAIAVSSRIGLPLDVVEIGRESVATTETGARAARYAAFEKAVAAGRTVATGHTSDDQAETVLHHLLRGSGLDGLAGIPPRRGRFVRPLLDVSRSDVRELAALLGLPVRDDPSNQDLRHLRNRIRLELIPMLEAGYAREVSVRLARTARILRRDLDVLEDLAAEVPVDRIPGGSRVALGNLAAVSEAVAARIVRRALRLAVPPHPGSEGTVAEALEVAAGTRGTATTGGVTIAREPPWLTILTEEGPVPGAVALRVPGETSWGIWSFSVSVRRSRPPVPLSAAAIVLPLGEDPVFEIRPLRSDDALGHRRASELLREAGVPPRLRPRHPVVLLDGDPVWIPGVRRSDSTDGESDRYLCAVATEGSVWDTFER